MDALLVTVGLLLVAVALADLVNTLVTTSTSYARLWPSRLVTRGLFVLVRGAACRLPEGSALRERLLASFGPVSLLLLLAMWAGLQVVGFALVWSATAGVATIEGFGDAVYYSGVVFFTVGFGEIVPESLVPRLGALAEAFLGVATTALVIGYLPSLYAAYSERERALLTIDDGSGERITPTDLVFAWSPDADPKKLEARFEEWSEWAARIEETHTTLPVLRLFRSHDPRQHWVTALGCSPTPRCTPSSSSAPTTGTGTGSCDVRRPSSTS
ncbi:MAG: potassium channel family protein [Actinomycetes bacterium]